MAVAVIMPRQGQSVESCIITKWHKKEGDKVASGDLLFSYETDKSSFDELSTVDGVLLKILRPEDDDVPCLENVCVIGNPGEDISAFLGGAEVVEEKKPEPTEVKVEKVAPVVATEVKVDGNRVFASPRAKNLAEKLGVDVSLASPTGAQGRIMERDVERLVANGLPVADEVQEVKAEPAVSAPVANGADYVEEKLPNIRKVIAKAMHNSLQSTAQLTLNTSFDASEIMAFRAKIKPMIEKGELNKITVNDIVMYVVSRVLLRHKEVNANLIDDKMRFFNTVNLGMAVDTPRGLLVPTLFHAEKFNLNDMSAELKNLAKSAQSGTISPDLLSGGSFTVSNLGTLGVESFTPVINAPQTAILGVCTLTDRVKVVNGEIKAYKAMGLSLTFDHRALDGAPAAKFLKDVANGLENFSVFTAINN